MSSGTRQFNSPGASTIAGYKSSDLDAGGTTEYFGFIDPDGKWYILRLVSDTNVRYAAGSSDYATNWTNRASLSYDYYNNVF